MADNNRGQNLVAEANANFVKENIVKESPAETTSKLRHTIAVDNVDKTTKVNKHQLAFSCDTLLSNPQNKRFREGFEGKSLMEVFAHMTSSLRPESLVKISNGTKTTELSVQDWKKYITMCDSLFISDDKSPDQNVWIRVVGKSVAKEATELNTL
ncbi:MAG: hypothetical protein DRJ03_23660 [Chloroflexi bacterium]|nr:MAG: hypothetical protein DRJ03_23660 [Chloroflexota bacterium]